MTEPPTESPRENDEIQLSMPLIGLESDVPAQDHPSRRRPGQAGSGRNDWRGRRDRWAGEHRLSLSLTQSLPPRLPPNRSFARLPFDLLLAYQQHREASELGRIFRIANELHDHIDAVVVIGTPVDCLPAQLLMQACCDPYHNEQSRAVRGSKPRLYFLTDPIDNDRVQSLIDRISVGGYGDVDAERRWGLIWSDASTPLQSGRNRLLFETLFALLQRRGDWQSRPGRPSLVTYVGPADRLQPSTLRHFGIDQSLSTPGNLVGSPLNAFAPLGLLVAAFLGLDIVRYLVGALAVTQNCFSAEPASNLAVRYAAANALDGFGRAAVGPPPRRWTAVPDRSLLPIAEWMSCVDAWWPDRGTADACGGIVVAGGGPASRLHGRAKPNSRNIVNHLRVDSIRTDPLPVDRSPFAGRVVDRGQVPSRGGSAGSVSLAELAAEDQDAWRRSLGEAGFAANVLRLPAIETAWLGQLLQLHLLAWSVASAGWAIDRDRV